MIKYYKSRLLELTMSKFSLKDFKPVETFDDVIIPIKKLSNTLKKKKVRRTRYQKMDPLLLFDSHTTDYYRATRMTHTDPIMNEEISLDKAFLYHNMWDPYTGEVTEKDPYGPLVFDPTTLLRFFYLNRCSHLWGEPVDEDGGYYQGYYEDGVGAGETFDVAKGAHPEWYLFRIPINDCYLPPNPNLQFISFGPKLSDEDIELIDRLVAKDSAKYKKMYKRKPPLLANLKKLYDTAISIAPIPIELFGDVYKTKEEYNTACNKVNRDAVDSLVKMKFL
jgi:hypothetical protein